MCVDACKFAVENLTHNVYVYTETVAETAAQETVDVHETPVETLSAKIATLQQDLSAALNEVRDDTTYTHRE